MVGRTARKGPNRGNRFWSCSRYPDCRGARSASAVVRASANQVIGSGWSGAGGPEEDGSSVRRIEWKVGELPVVWEEGWKDAGRPVFASEYLEIGALPGISPAIWSGDPEWGSGLQQVLSHGLLLSRRDRAREPTDRSRLVSGLLLKLLCRGRTPFPTLDVERQGLEGHGLMDRVIEFDEKSAEIGWGPRRRAAWRASPRAVLAVAAERDPFVLDPGIDPDAAPDGSLCDSDLEVRFLKEWALQALGPEAGHWFTPQAPLDKLLQSRERSDGAGARRVDFLFCHPGGVPLVIEIDGPEHAGARAVDQARDDELRSIGLDVVRVPNEEMSRLDGPNLRRIRDHCQEAFAALPPPTRDVDLAVAQFAMDCAVAAKVQAAVAKAIAYGWLVGGADWEIDIRGAGAAAAAGVRDVLDLLVGFGALYGWHAVPASCTVRVDGGDVSAWTPAGEGARNENAESRARAESLRITVESRASPFPRAVQPVRRRAPRLRDPSCLPPSVDRAGTVLPRSARLVRRRGNLERT